MKLSRATFLLSFAAVALSTQISCSSGKPQAATYAIGEKVQVGKLFYQVLDAQWTAELKGAKQSPKNRILQLQIAVTNSGAQTAALPFLRLIDAKGNEIMEFSEIEGNSSWLGALRRKEPSLTEQGYVFFDVPVGAYKLEVLDNSNAEDERIAYIDIPASLAPPAQVTSGSSGA